MVIEGRTSQEEKNMIRTEMTSFLLDADHTVRC